MAEFKPVDCFDLIIFGGTGDLSLRKLLPALYRRDRDGQISPDSRIIAVGRSTMDTNAYIEMVAYALKDIIAKDADSEQNWKRFNSRLSYVGLNALDLATWAPLCNTLQGYEQRIRALYLATAPELFGPVAAGFEAQGLMTDDMRIVLEKPVGSDYNSAKEINDAVGASFRENQIFRIDHYLGKETVQNLLALRFGNSLFEPLWGRQVVDHVQITVAEDLGVGNRIDFYDDIGTLRDMVQNHLMQLVCLVAMEPPSSLEDDAVRDEKMKVLRALKPITSKDVLSSTVRAQYTAGAIAGTTVDGYTDELASASTTETFVALKLEIDNWRWSGVPFYLRSGKRLPEKHSEIVLNFKPVPHVIFDETQIKLPANKLSIRLQPDEGVKLSIMAKEPGPGGFNLQPVALDLSFADAFEIAYSDAYERLLVEVMRGNPALFMRRDEIETAWKWIDGIIEGWKETKQPVENYVAGSWGPTASALLLDRDGRKWQVGS